MTEPIDWEAIWVPYDEETYRFVVERIYPFDVVVDIGAGDLRLSSRVANIASWVYAIERNPEVLARADRYGQPENLVAVCTDAHQWPMPNDVTVGVLLMRHCTPEHFADYVARLKAMGCRRLITNARWKMGVEEIDLRSAVPYNPALVGWYACQCGSVGFTPGDPQQVTDQVLNTVVEVVNCPHCVPVESVRE
ncbi:MAG: class I SAM-dependent methyltransferase [Chloroflexi bacterium]|nr:class I SAM-dependent methyltransferase [Chloroflexota bacterium]